MYLLNGINSRGSSSMYTSPNRIQPTHSFTLHCAHRLGLTYFISSQTVCLQYSGLYKTTYRPNYASQRLSYSSEAQIQPLDIILLWVGWDLNKVIGCGHHSPHTALIMGLLWKLGTEITGAPPNQNTSRWAEQVSDYSTAVQKLEGGGWCGFG